MQELTLHAVIREPGHVRGAVALGAFTTDDPQTIIYREARAWFADLIQGRPFPLTMVIATPVKLEALVALTVFLTRSLAVHPATPSLLTDAELVDSYGPAGAAHIDRDRARFFSFLIAFLDREGLGASERETQITQIVNWVRAYIVEGQLPALPFEPPLPRVIERGTNGFVVADTPAWASMEAGWVELFREGHLRGVLLGRARNDRVAVLAAKKSAFVTFDLERAAAILNEAELRQGEPATWYVADGLWLFGPPEGTLLLPTAILTVLLRV